MLFTGLPASGKSTLALATQDLLTSAGIGSSILDGDALRREVSSDLGFSAEDRAENLRRAAELALARVQKGLVALMAMVAPYCQHRAQARALHERAGWPFLEVFVNTPLEQCVRRDPKGLYVLAQAGKLDHLTGWSDVYEPPLSPELELTPDMGSPARQAELVFATYVSHSRSGSSPRSAAEI